MNSHGVELIDGNHGLVAAVAFLFYLDILEGEVDRWYHMSEIITMLLSLSMTKRKVMTLAKARENRKQFFFGKKKKVSVWEDHQNWGWVKIANFEANSSGFQARQQSMLLIIHTKFELTICASWKKPKVSFQLDFHIPELTDYHICGKVQKQTHTCCPQCGSCWVFQRKRNP